VHLGCHSNGCLMALALLQAMPPAWVARHVGTPLACHYEADGFRAILAAFFCFRL